MCKCNYYESMGFKENLKAELSFKGMMVKELAEKTKINKSTLDNYLRDKHSSPTVENAVKIARALDVSVEYLVTGNDGKSAPKENMAIIHHINSDLRKLDSYDLLSIFSLIKRMAEK